MAIGEDSHLITPSSIDNVDDAISALGTKLQDHSLLSYTQTHGNWTDSLQNALSVGSGVRVARRLVRVKVGSLFFLLPADVSVTGPPTYPVITIHPADKFSKAGPGDPQPDVTFQITATGLHPMTFKWQIYDCSLPGKFVNLNYVDAVIGQLVTGSEGTRVRPNAITTVQIDPTTSSSSMKLDCFSGGEGTKDPATYIRCKVDNLGVDGGEVISNPVNTQWNGTMLIPASRPVGGAKLKIKDET